MGGGYKYVLWQEKIRKVLNIQLFPESSDDVKNVNTKEAFKGPHRPDCDNWNLNNSLLGLDYITPIEGSKVITMLKR